MSTQPENAPSQSASLVGGKSSSKTGDLPPPGSKTMTGGGAVNGSSATAASAANKFSMYNINSQFKGKSIEPQQKTNIIRQIPSGLQTLGKVVAARRMPPPSNLPSLAKSTGQTIIPQTDTNTPTTNGSSTQHTNTANSATSNLNLASGGSSSEQVPVTIAAVVSGTVGSTLTPVANVSTPQNVQLSQTNQQSWPTPLVASQTTTESHQANTPDDGPVHSTYKTYSNTTKWGQNEFPNLADAALLTQQQNQQKQQQQIAMNNNNINNNNEQASNSNVIQATPQYNNGPVLKPSNVGNWGMTNQRGYQQQHDAEMLLTDKQLVQNTHPSGQQSNDYSNQNGQYNYNNGNNGNNTSNNRQQVNNSGSQQYRGQNQTYNNGNNSQNMGNNNNNNNNNNQGNYRNGKSNGNGNYNNNNGNNRQNAYNNSNGGNNKYQNYHNQSYSQYHESTGYTVPSIVKEKDFNHIDDLINNTQGGSEAASGGQYGKNGRFNNNSNNTNTGEQLNGTGSVGFVRKEGQRDDMPLDYGGEENWAYISQNVDYNEKIQFLDDEEEEEEELEPKGGNNNNVNKMETEVNDQKFDQSSSALPDDESQWDQKRKYNDDEMKKSIERARLRRAEEERRFSEQRQAVCAEKLRQLNLKKQQQQVNMEQQQNCNLDKSENSDAGNRSQQMMNVECGNNSGELSGDSNEVKVQYRKEEVVYYEENVQSGGGGRTQHNRNGNLPMRNVKSPHQQIQYASSNNSNIVGQQNETNRNSNSNFNTHNRQNYNNNSKTRHEEYYDEDTNYQSNTNKTQISHNSQNQRQPQQQPTQHFQGQNNYQHPNNKTNNQKNTQSTYYPPASSTIDLKSINNKNAQQSHRPTSANIVANHVSPPNQRPKKNEQNEQHEPQQKPFKHLSQNLPEVESKMQSLGKKPMGNNKSVPNNNDSVIGSHHSKPDEALKMAPQLDQWSTNRLQQIIKSDQSQSQESAGGNSKQQRNTDSSRQMKPNDQYTNHHHPQDTKVKRERNENSESSSAKSVKVYAQGGQKGNGKNHAQNNTSKESSVEPNQNDSRNQVNRNSARNNKSNNQQRNTNNNSSQYQHNNQKYHNQTQQCHHQQLRYQQKPVYHTSATDNGFAPEIYDSNEEQHYVKSSHTHRQQKNQRPAEVYDDEDEYEDDYSDNEKQDANKQTNRSFNNSNRTGNNGKSSYAGRITNGNQTLNKRSVNIVSPASNFRRGGNANTTRSAPKPGNNEEYESMNGVNNNSKRNTRQNLNNNNNFTDNYVYENNSDYGQGNGKVPRYKNQTNSNYNSESVNQGKNSGRNRGQQQNRSVNNSGMIVTLETQANTSTTNSVHSDNKSTRSNRHSTGKHDVLTDVDLNDEWETASDSSLVNKHTRTELPIKPVYNNTSGSKVNSTRPVANQTNGYRPNRTENYNQSNQGNYQGVNPRQNKYQHDESGRSANNSSNNNRTTRNGGRGSNNRQMNRRNKNGLPEGGDVKSTVKLDDPRYTAKYWTSTAATTDSATDGQTQQQQAGPNSENTKTALESSSNPTSTTTTNTSYPTDPSKKSFTKQRPINQQAPRSGQQYISKNRDQKRSAQNNMQVYRVENIVASDPSAIKDALSQATVPKQPVKKVDALYGIDLSSAGVVIVDYLPEEVTSRNHSNENCNSDDEDLDSDDNDGFQQVMTKKDKKAEKLKAAQAAAALAAASLAANLKNSKQNVNYNSKQRDGKVMLKTNSTKQSIDKGVPNKQSNSERKTPIPSLFSTTVKPVLTAAMLEATKAHTDSKSQNRRDLMTNIETWNNEIVSSSSSSPNKPTQPAENATTKAGAQKYNQVVNNTKAKSEDPSMAKKDACGPLSPSVDLNLKIESCKKVWECPSESGKSQNKKSSTTVKKVVTQPLMSIQTKKSDSLKVKETQPVIASGSSNKTSLQTTVTNKNVCTVKPNVSTVKPQVAPQTVPTTTTITTTTVETAMVSPAGDSVEGSPVSEESNSATSVIPDAAPAANNQNQQATIINHYYDKILINQATAANNAVAAAATAAAVAASAAVSAAVTVTTMQKQQQQINNQSTKVESLNESVSSVKSNTSNSEEAKSSQIVKVTPQKIVKSNDSLDNSATTPTQANTSQTTTATAVANPSSAQYSTQMSTTSNTSYPLTSSVNNNGNMNVSGNTSTMGNVSASPSSSVSSYLSMPSLSNNSFGFGQQQQQALLQPNHQVFQNFYQPQIMQPFSNHPQAKNTNAFNEDFNQQQEAFALYPQQGSYHPQQLGLQAPLLASQQLMGPHHNVSISHPALPPQGVYQGVGPNRGIHPGNSAQFDQQQAFQNQQFFNQQGNKPPPASNNSLQQSNKTNPQLNKSEFPIAPGTFVSSAISKPNSQQPQNQQASSTNQSANSPLISTLQYQQHQVTKQEAQYFNNFNTNFNPFNNTNNNSQNNSNTSAAGGSNVNNGGGSNNGVLNSSNSNNFFQNNFMSQIASLSLNQQQSHHNNQFGNNNSLNSLFSSSNNNGNNNNSSINSTTYNQQHPGASQFGFNSIIQQQQQHQQQQRQTPLTPSSLSNSASFITNNGNSNSNQTSINHLIQMQQQKSQFENVPDSFFSGNSNLDSTSYFANNSNSNSTNNTKLNSSAINRPANNASNSANTTLLNISNKQISSFDNGFINNSYQNTGYHHQVAGHEQGKPNLSSVTPPMSGAGSSFFNNNSNMSSSNNNVSQQITNTNNHRIGASNLTNSSYPLDSHQYHHNQQQHQYHQQQQMHHNQHQYHFNNQHKANQLPPALLPQPPQPILGNNNQFTKEQTKIATQPQRQTNYNQIQQQTNSSRQMQAPTQLQNSLNSRANNSANFNQQRRPNQTFYNNNKKIENNLIGVKPNLPPSKTPPVATKIVNTNVVKPDAKTTEKIINNNTNVKSAKPVVATVKPVATSSAEKPEDLAP